MKYLLAIILLIMSGGLCIYAQQEDTTKVMVPFNAVLGLKDSILQDKSSLVPLFSQSDYKYLNRNIHALAPGLGKPEQGTGILNSPCSKFFIPVALVSYGLITRGK